MIMTFVYMTGSCIYTGNLHVENDIPRLSLISELDVTSFYLRDKRNDD